MENYVPLHVHSVYSIMDALNTPQQLVEAASKAGHKAIALTDHGSMGGLLKLQNACNKSGIKPILGMEGYVVDQLARYNDKDKRIRDKNNHVILLAKNEQGYKNILKLNYLANNDTEHFYYKPRFTFRELFENNEGIIVGSACLASGFANLIKRGLERDAENLFQKFIEVFGEDFYAELQLNEIGDSSGEPLSQKSYNDWLIYQATKNGVPLVLAGDIHYIEKEGYQTQKLSFDIRRNNAEKKEGLSAEENTEDLFLCHNLYYHKIEDFKNFNTKFGYNYTNTQIESWCNNSTIIADKIGFQIKERDRMFLPRQCFDEDDELIKQAKRGLCEHFNVVNLSECPKEYVDRLNYEISILVKKGVSRYFLCLKDICDYADSIKMSRGVARGSAGGSLTACCLNVTSWVMDPIKNGLIFERFVSEARLKNCYFDYKKE